MISSNIDIDNSARTKIVSQFDKNFFVEAGAGSGKTTVLVERMVGMVEAGKDVSNICAITFTKAAANEFYSRFQKRLTERSVKETKQDKYPGRLTVQSEETMKNCRKALNNIDLCFMGTIDSFTNKILSEHPSEARVPADAVVVDDEKMQEILENFYTLILNGDYGQQLMNKAVLFSEINRNAKKIFVLAVEKMMKLRSANIIIENFVKQDLDSVYKEKKKALYEILSFLENNQQAIYTKSVANEKYTLELIKRKFLFTDYKNWNDGINDIIDALKDISKLRLKPDDEVKASVPYFELYFVEHLSKNKVAWYEPGENLTRIATELNEYNHKFGMNFIYECLNIITAKLRKEGILTYFDYMLYLRDMLKDDAKKEGKLIHHIYNRYKYFMIDESQDTDPLQSEIFFYLSSSRPTEIWYENKPIPGSLFIVGDPKQSIYRFKNADVTSYNRIKKLFNNEVGEVIYLYQNFRSTEIIKNYFNETFMKVLAEEKENQSKYEVIPNVDLCKSRDSEFSGVFYYEVAASKRNAETEDMDEYKVMKMISTMTNNENYQIYDNGIKRKLSYKDFMLITSSKGSLSKYSKILGENSIPYRVEGSIDFKESEVLSLLIILYNAICIRDNNTYFYMLLKSVLFNLNDNDIVSLKQRGFTMNVYADNSEIEMAEELRDKLSVLKSLVEESIYCSASELFNIILEKYPLLAKSSLENLDYAYYVLELLRKNESDGTICNLKDGSKYLNTLLESSADIERCVGLSTETDKVHLANLHKVKGLEAPIVILLKAGVSNYSNKVSCRVDYTSNSPECHIFNIPDRKSSNAKYLDCGDLYSVYKEKEIDDLKAEGIRQLYVAATRARNCLIISCSINKDGEKSGKWVPLISENVKQLELKEDAEKKKKQSQSFDGKQLYEQGKENIFSDNTVKKESYHFTKPSEIKYHDHISEKDDQQYSIFSDKRDAALLGTFVHRLMEILVLSKNRVNITEAINSIIDSYDFKDNYYYDLLNQTALTIRNGGYQQENGGCADILNELLEADEVYCELPFSYHNAKDNLLYNGVIDVLYRSADKWHIVDYKTNADGNNLEEKYASQLSAYVSAIKETSGIQADARIYHINI